MKKTVEQRAAVIAERRTAVRVQLELVRICRLFTNTITNHRGHHL